MISRTLGRGGPAVSAIGLGCMGMSDLYGPAERAESLGALTVELGAEDLARIEAAVPRGAVAGARYPDPIMAHLDSERRARR